MRVWPLAIGFREQMAKLQGAHRVIMVGTQADASTWLPMARELGFIPVNSQELPVEVAIKAITGKSTVDVAIECVGGCAVP